MAADLTHGQAVIAATATAVTKTLVGTIELPTRQTGWTIDKLSAQIVPQTLTAAEAVGGIISLDSVSGDIVPDPRPSNFPIYALGSFLGATHPQINCPLHDYPLNLQAAGKANINFNFSLDIAATAAPIIAAGVKYGPAIALAKPFQFCDRVRSTITVNTNTQVGTIQLSEKATRITGILGVLQQDGVITAAEELAGIFSLRSDDVDLVPSFWLFNDIFSAGLGALIAGGEASPPKPHVVDIPVPGGARIDCFVDLLTAVTNAADVSIFLFYE